MHKTYQNYNRIGAFTVIALTVTQNLRIFVLLILPDRSTFLTRTPYWIASLEAYIFYLCICALAHVTDSLRVHVIAV